MGLVYRDHHVVRAGRRAQAPALLELLDELLDRHAQGGQRLEVLQAAGGDSHRVLAFGDSVGDEPRVLGEEHIQFRREEPVYPFRADVRVDVRLEIRSARSTPNGTMRNDLPLPLRVEEVEHRVHGVDVLLANEVRVVLHTHVLWACRCGKGEDELLWRVRVPVLPLVPQGQVGHLRVDEQVRDGDERVRRDHPRGERRWTRVHGVHQVAPIDLLSQHAIDMRGAATGGDDHIDAELLAEEVGYGAVVAPGPPSERYGQFTLLLRGFDQRIPLGLEQGDRVGRGRRLRGRRGGWRGCRCCRGISATGHQYQGHHPTDGGE